MDIKTLAIFLVTFLVQLELLTIVSILNIFNIWIVVSILISGWIIFIYYLFNRRRFNFRNRISIISFIIILIFSIGTFSFHHYTIDGARDHGAYFSAAINLAKNGSLVQENRHTLTFPGFKLRDNYIVPHPSPTYEVWLAVGYIFFKEKGVFLMSAFLSFCLLMVLSAIAKEIFKLSSAESIWVIVLFATHYFVIWITRSTLNENLFLLLFFSSFLTFVYGALHKNIYFSLISILALEVCLMVRQETIIILLPIFFYSIFYYRIYFTKNIKILMIYVFSFLLFLLPYLYYFWFIDKSGFDQMAKLLTFISLQFGITSNTAIEAVKTYPSFGKYLTIFSINRFIQYYGEFVLLSGIFLISCLHGIKNIHFHKQIIIAIFLFFGPFLITFINPNNATDLPYFMRRFYLFYPLLLFFSIKLLSTNLRHAKLYILLLILFIHISQSSKILAFVEYDGITKQIEKLDQRLLDNSTILLIDGKARGYSTNPYGFLYNIGIWAPYWHFTTGKDIVLLQKIPKLDKSIPKLIERNLNLPIYVISASLLEDFKLSDYGSQTQIKNLQTKKLIYIGLYTISTNQLQPSSLIRYYVDQPGWKYSEVEKMIGDPFPSEIRTINYDFFIYELI